ncbi:MAG: hypothetical protein ACREQQ_03740 [Candidatus Binatia bacterium]
MRAIQRVSAIGLVSLIAIVGCGDDDDDDDVFESLLSGSYIGTIQDNIAGPGTLDVDITQSGSSYSGSFFARYANPGFDNSGTVSGTVSGNEITIIINSADPSVCDFIGSGTRRSEDRITGSFQETESCIDDVSGTFDISR